MPLSIIIVGAGIAGLCTAVALRQAGHTVKVSKSLATVTEGQYCCFGSQPHILSKLLRILELTRNLLDIRKVPLRSRGRCSARTFFEWNPSAATRGILV